MKKTRIVCLALTMLILSGCAVGVGTAPVSYSSSYASPSLVVIPGTYVYVAPDLGADIYFHVGYWWRLSDGFWYRSHYCDRGWSRYQGVPVFYRQVDPGWRTYYAKRQWRGHPWHYERIPAHRVQQEWSRWETTRHWEKRDNWGVQGWSAAGHRQHNDAAWPPARTAQRQPDRHQEYRTDRVRGENVDSRPERRQNDRTRREQSAWQPRNRQNHGNVVETRTQEGWRMGNRPERPHQDFVQRRAREEVTRQSPENGQPQDGRRWQERPERQEREEMTRQSPENGHPQDGRRWQERQERQEREEMTRQSPENGQPQDGRRWQERPERQEREEVTRQSPENGQPQDGRRWQARQERQEREEMTRQSPENGHPQDGRRWQARQERQERVVNAEAELGPDQYRQRAHEGDRQPRAERRPRRDGADSSNALPQPTQDTEIIQDPISPNP